MMELVDARVGGRTAPRPFAPGGGHLAGWLTRRRAVALPRCAGGDIFETAEVVSCFLRLYRAVLPDIAPRRVAARALGRGYAAADDLARGFIADLRARGYPLADADTLAMIERETGDDGLPFYTQSIPLGGARGWHDDIEGGYRPSPLETLIVGLATDWEAPGAAWEDRLHLPLPADALARLWAHEERYLLAAWRASRAGEASARARPTAASPTRTDAMSVALGGDRVGAFRRLSGPLRDAPLVASYAAGATTNPLLDLDDEDLPLFSADMDIEWTVDNIAATIHLGREASGLRRRIARARTALASPRATDSVLDALDRTLAPGEGRS